MYFFETVIIISFLGSFSLIFTRLNINNLNFLDWIFFPGPGKNYTANLENEWVSGSVSFPWRKKYDTFSAKGFCETEFDWGLFVFLMKILSRKVFSLVLTLSEYASLTGLFKSSNTLSTEWKFGSNHLWELWGPIGSNWFLLMLVVIG